MTETLPHPVELKRRAMGTGTPPEMRAKVRRERFESRWADTRGRVPDRRADGTYIDGNVRMMWESYKWGWEDSK